MARPAVQYACSECGYTAGRWFGKCPGCSLFGTLVEEKVGPAAGSAFETHAGPLTEMVLLGNVAIRLGRTLELNPATGEVTNCTVPDEYVRPNYRAGWSL